MAPTEFRRYGHEVVDLVARYLEGLDGISPLPQVNPGEVLAALAPSPPEEGEELDTILGDIERILLPASTHWNHPRFFAYFNSTSAVAGILGELIAASVNANAMLWRTGPAATELEYLTCGWLAELLGLPGSFDGHINDTASTSTMVALGAARHRAAPESREQGLSGLPPLRVYGSTQTHSSVEKAVVALGMGRRGYRPVPCDPEFRMIPEELERAIAEDLEAGVIPCAVVATAGTTATTSVDPIPAIAEVASQHHLWLHVDAAHGGVAAILPERRWVLEGADRADSLVVNPHKWLFTPMDCSVLFTAHPEAIRRAFSLVPAYLETPEADRDSEMGSRNLMDLGVALGRRQRALKLWMVMRYFGRSGLQRLLRSHLQMADWLRRQLEAGGGWEVMAPVPLATVCFRHHPKGSDEESGLGTHNRELMRLVNESGEAFISHAAPDGRFLLRATVGGLRTTPHDVERLFAALQLAASRAA